MLFHVILARKARQPTRKIYCEGSPVTRIIATVLTAEGLKVLYLIIVNHRDFVKSSGHRTDILVCIRKAGPGRPRRSARVTSGRLGSPRDRGEAEGVGEREEERERGTPAVA